MIDSIGINESKISSVDHSDPRVEKLEKYLEIINRAINSETQLEPRTASALDRKVLPDLVDLANLKKEGLNAYLMSSPMECAQKIMELKNQGEISARFIVKAAGNSVHFAAFDYALINDKPSVIGVEPATMNGMGPEMLAIQFQTAFSQTLPDVPLVIIESDLQRSNGECGMFSLFLIKKMLQEKAHFEQLHKDNIDNKINTYSSNLLVNIDEANRLLPLSFLKHVQSATRMKAFLSENPGSELLKVNKKQQTLSTRFNINLIETETSGKTIEYSRSIEIKRKQGMLSLITLRGVERRAQVLAGPTLEAISALRAWLINQNQETPLQILRRLSQKNEYGEYRLCTQLDSQLRNQTLESDKATGVALNDMYLQSLQRLVGNSENTAAAELAARLLRSPDNGHFKLNKIPGYYQTVLMQGQEHPLLLASLQSLLDVVKQTAQPGATDKLTTKISSQLETTLHNLGMPAGPPTQPASAAAMLKKLDEIAVRTCRLAMQKALTEQQQLSSDSRQKQWETQINQGLESFRLSVPPFMVESIRSGHIEALEITLKVFEQRKQALGEQERAEREPRLESLRESAQGYRSAVSTMQSRLEHIKEQPASSLSKLEKAELKQAMKNANKALEAVEHQAFQLADTCHRQMEQRVQALTHEMRSKLVEDLLANGLYVEQPDAERAALTYCLNSPQAKRLIKEAVRESVDLTGQLNKEKMTRLISERLMSQVMDDSFFRDKIAKIDECFRNQTRLASATASAVPELTPAHRMIDAAQQTVADSAQSQVAEQTQAVVKTQIRTEAEAEARQAVNDAARKQVEDTANGVRRRAEEDMLKVARKRAEDEAMTVARRRAEEEAANLARRRAEEEAGNAARRAAEAAIQKQTQSLIRKQVEPNVDQWIYDFQHGLVQADVNLIEARLLSLKEERFLEMIEALPQPSTTEGSRVANAQAIVLSRDGKPYSV